MFLAPLGAWLAANAGAIGAGSALAGAGTTVGSTYIMLLKEVVEVSQPLHRPQPQPPT